MTKFRYLILLLVLAGAVLGCAGCATEPENESTRPWNTPEGWQNGAFPMLTQPH